MRHRSRFGLFRSVAAGLMAFVVCIGMLPASVFASEIAGTWGDGDVTTFAVPGSGAVVAFELRGSGTSGDSVSESTDSNGVVTWDVSGTDLRNLKITVSVNISASTTLGNGTVDVQIPYKLQTGRVVDGKQVTPTCYARDGLDKERRWRTSVEGDTVHIRNVADVTVGVRHTVGVEYLFDCWNTVSDEQFEIPLSVKIDGQSSVDTVLHGRIHTGYSVEMASYHYGHPGFSYVLRDDRYLDRWNVAYEKYFGLTKAEFDAASPTYVYDILPVTVLAKGQQPCDIEGTFVPGQYPSVNDKDKQPVGWSGELVGGIYMLDPAGDPDAFVPLEITSKQLGASYSSLPNACGSSAGVNWYGDAVSKSWNKYSFRLAYGDLPKDSDGNRVVVSSFSDADSSEVNYKLFFLVKYKNDDSIKGSERPGKSGCRMLSGTVELAHRGIDAGVKADGGFGSKLIFWDTMDQVYYGGDIYSDTYVLDQSSTESKSGLSSLRSGNSATLDMTVDYFCFNENRDVIPTGYSDGYALEAIVDLGMIGHSDAGGAVTLEPGDYRFTKYKLCVIDSDGIGAMNPDDGSEIVGWAGYDIPQWVYDENASVSVYGSTTREGDDLDHWIKLGDDIPLAEIWPKNSYRGIEMDYRDIKALTDEDIVRLKVVYKGSRKTTAIRLGYQVELLPDGPVMSKAIADASGADSIQLTSWCNYTAYHVTDYEKNYASGKAIPDLKTKWGDVDANDTGILARRFDRMHPYPNYVKSASDPANDASPFPYRNFMKTTLGSSTDAIGMVVSQALFSPAGLVGANNTAVVSSIFSRKTDVNDVTGVIYSVTGAVTNHADTDADLASRVALDKDIVSPYNAATVRYYVLLPEGLRCDPSDVLHWAQSTFENESDPLSMDLDRVVSKLTIPGVADHVDDHNATVYWGGLSWDIDVDTYMIGNRQLVVADRHFGYDSYYNVSLTNNYVLQGYYTGSGFQYFYGRGIKLLAKPVDGQSVPCGNHETLFLCQFLDAGGNPIVIDGGQFANEGIYETAAEALGEARGAAIDEYVTHGDGATLLDIATAFRNGSGTGSTSASIKVKSGEIDKSNPDAYSDTAMTEIREGVYNYELTFRLSEGTSRNVVLWDDLERYDRYGLSCEWRGILTGVDTNDTGASVWVNMNENFEGIDYYVANKAGYEWLQDGKHGWTKVTNLDTYAGWEQVRAIAFWFENTDFEGGADGRDTATVYLTMHAPETVFKVFDGQEVYTTYDEIAFSDVHVDKTQSLAGIALSNSASVKLSWTAQEEPEPDPIGGFEMPKTGGTGTLPYCIMGCAMIACSLAYYGYVRRRRVE